MSRHVRKCTRISRGLSTLLLGLALCAPWPVVAAAEGAPVLVVITAANNGVTDIPVAALRRCFTGKTVSVGGVKLVPFNHPPDSAARTRFDERILGMSPMESKRFWIDSLIRGGTRAPRTVPDPRLLLKVVAGLRGAISYVDARLAAAPGIARPKIGGVDPTRPKYPLR